MMLSASNMPVPDYDDDNDNDNGSDPGAKPTSVLLLPAFTVVEHVTPALVPDLIRYFVNNAVTTTTPLAAASKTSSSEEESPPTATIPPTPLRAHPSPHAAVILLCSHRTRDARCGISAPLLKREFERHLRALGLYRDAHDTRPGGVGVYFVSHVGGHRYAANVIVYRRRDFEWYKHGGVDGDAGGKDSGADEGAAQGIWIARVRPEDCEGIVRFTVLQGKVVRPGTQLRGGFDRERGVVSW
ncbi:hypothetical protein VTN02DRAFT_6794 [Thermoascus thermophilus]